MLKMNLKRRRIKFEPRVKLNHNIYHLGLTRLEVKSDNNNCLLMNGCFSIMEQLKLSLYFCMVGVVWVFSR